MKELQRGYFEFKTPNFPRPLKGGTCAWVFKVVWTKIRYGLWALWILNLILSINAGSERRICGVGVPPHAVWFTRRMLLWLCGNKRFYWFYSNWQKVDSNIGVKYQFNLSFTWNLLRFCTSVSPPKITSEGNMMVVLLNILNPEEDYHGFKAKVRAVGMLNWFPMFLFSILMIKIDPFAIQRLAQ